MKLYNTLYLKDFYRTMAFRIMVAMLGAMVVSSCYLPQRFDAEVEVDAAGYYSMVFDGYLVETGLYEGLRKQTVSQEEEAQKVAVIERDLTRDPAVSNFEYFKQAHFRVKWERKGDLLKAKTVTFLRRNESMISLKYVEGTGLVEMMGRSLRQVDRERIAQTGLGMAGEIRLKSSLPVVDHNATKVIQDKTDQLSKWYIWKIENIFQPTPRILLKIE